MYKITNRRKRFKKYTERKWEKNMEKNIRKNGNKLTKWLRKEHHSHYQPRNHPSRHTKHLTSELLKVVKHDGLRQSMARRILEIPATPRPTTTTCTFANPPKPTQDIWRRVLPKKDRASARPRSV